MSATEYATLDDLAQWVDDDLPITSPNVLRSAAYSVADRIALSVYTVDPLTGLPQSAALVGALRDATCAQAAWLLANEINPLGGAATSGTVQSSVKIGSAQIEYAGASAAAAARARGMHGLCDEAERIIQRAGFSTTIVNLPSWLNRTDII